MSHTKQEPHKAGRHQQRLFATSAEKCSHMGLVWARSRRRYQCASLGSRRAGAHCIHKHWACIHNARHVVSKLSAVLKLQCSGETIYAAPRKLPKQQ